jgi:type IV secretion system protein TrbI
MHEPFNNLNQDPTDAEREDLLIRAAPRRVSGLRRQTIRLTIALLAVVVAAALIFGLGIGFRGRGETDERKIETPPENMQPSSIADLPSSYADIPQPKSPPAPKAPAAESNARHEDDATASQNADLARLLESIQQIGRKNQELAQQIANYQAQLSQEQAKVWASGLFFKLDQPPDQQERSAQAPGATMPSEAKVGAENAGASQPASPEPEGLSAQQASPVMQASPASQAPTDQQRKLAFLNESPAPRMDIDRLSLSQLAGDANGYLLQAGTVVPAALLTGINTDLPGDVVATVTQGVYDSTSGNHLLIPQGARLYGSYDSQISASQDRALLVWHRLLLPNGQSVDLDRMRGTDAAGYAGLADQVDYHMDQLASAALLSGVIAYAGNLSGGRQTLTQTPGDVVGDAVAQQASTVGSSIVQRQLNVQPTITIRPGWPVRVLVNRDILLPPYSE